jgi:uncharacterized protein YggT (Ycf19 family)
MRQITDTGRIITSHTKAIEPTHVDQEILQRVIGLIHLGVSLLNAFICTRFLLKLMAANPANPFAELIYKTTQPFLLLFQGLIRVITVNGNVFELSDLIAIAVYAMLGWSIVRLLRILFTRIN